MEIFFKASNFINKDACIVQGDLICEIIQNIVKAANSTFTIDYGKEYGELLYKFYYNYNTYFYFFYGDVVAAARRRIEKDMSTSIDESTFQVRSRKISLLSKSSCTDEIKAALNTDHNQFYSGFDKREERVRNSTKLDSYMKLDELDVVNIITIRIQGSSDMVLIVTTMYDLITDYSKLILYQRDFKLNDFTFYFYIMDEEIDIVMMCMEIRQKLCISFKCSVTCLQEETTFSLIGDELRCSVIFLGRTADTQTFMSRIAASDGFVINQFLKNRLHYPIISSPHLLYNIGQSVFTVNNIVLTTDSLIQFGREKQFTTLSSFLYSNYNEFIVELEYDSRKYNLFRDFGEYMENKSNSCIVISGSGTSQLFTTHYHLWIGTLVKIYDLGVDDPKDEIVRKITENSTKIEQKYLEYFFPVLPNNQEFKDEASLNATLLKIIEDYINSKLKENIVTIFLFDDLQDADYSSLKLLSYFLLRYKSSTKVFFYLSTYKDSDDMAVGYYRSHVNEIQIIPPDRNDILLLVNYAFQSSGCDNKLIDYLILRGKGIFHIIQLLMYLMNSGYIVVILFC